MKNSTSVSFGPNGSKQFTSYSEWAKDAKKDGLSILNVSSGPIAQNKDGTCMGAWFSITKKGWIIGEGV